MAVVNVWMSQLDDVCAGRGVPEMVLYINYFTLSVVIMSSYLFLIGSDSPTTKPPRHSPERTAITVLTFTRKYIQRQIPTLAS